MSGPGASNEQLHRNNLFSLEGRVALVTGGATGIGLMAAQALTTNGAKVYICGRREEELKKVVELYSPKSGGGSLHAISADITSKEGIKKLYEDFSKQEDCLHLLVNNAGVAVEEESKFANNEDLDMNDAQSFSDHLLRSTFDKWLTTMQTNVAGIFFMSATFLPLLAKGNETIRGYNSSILNITSISGIMKGASMGQYAYAASKAAAIQVTRNLGNTLVGTKVRVNAIAPGIFPSEMTAKSSQDNNKSELPEAGKGLPAGRPGKDEDMAGAVLFFAGRSGVFANGVILPLDGGATLTMASSM